MINWFDIKLFNPKINKQKPVEIKALKVQKLYNDSDNSDIVYY